MRNLRDWLWADSPTEALRLLGTGPGRGAFLGGGTTLACRSDPRLEFVVDLSRTGLDGFAASPDGLRIGSMRSLQSLVVDSDIGSFADGILARAASSTRTEPWRAQATLAGHLLVGEPGDLILSALLALDAEIELQEGEASATRIERLELALPDLQDRAPGLARPARDTPPTLVVAIRIPRPEPGWRFALEWLSRSAQDEPLAAVAVALRLDRQRVAEARVATAGLPRPRRAPSAEAALRGCPTGEFGKAQAALRRDTRPPADWRASAVYRAHLAEVLLGRALRAASDFGGRS